MLGLRLSVDSSRADRVTDALGRTDGVRRLVSVSAEAPAGEVVVSADVVPRGADRGDRDPRPAQVPARGLRAGPGPGGGARPCGSAALRGDRRRRLDRGDLTGILSGDFGVGEGGLGTLANVDYSTVLVALTAGVAAMLAFETRAGGQAETRRSPAEEVDVLTITNDAAEAIRVVREALELPETAGPVTSP